MTTIDIENARVLTVRQPWASAIAIGPKRVENRSRWTSYRGSIAIHAGLQLDREALVIRQPVLAAWLLDLPRTAAELPRGVVLATAQLTSVHWHLSPTCSCDGWAQHGGRTWHWQLDDVQTVLEPIAFRGGLGLRRAPELWSQLTQEAVS